MFTFTAEMYKTFVFDIEGRDLGTVPRENNAQKRSFE